MKLILMQWLRLAICLSVIWPVAVQAHSNGKSFLSLVTGTATGGQWSAQWDVHFQDLDLVLDLDQNLDGKLTRAEFQRAGGHFARLPAQQLKFSASGESCVVGDAGHKLVHEPGTSLLRLAFEIQCQGRRSPLVLDYQLLTGADASHRAVVALDGASQIVMPGVSTRLVGPDQGHVGRYVAFGGFVLSGIEHILFGWDHLAFLLALLIPLWLPLPHNIQPPGRSRTVRLVRLITAFTVAHSVTLALSVLGVYSPPVQPIETAIAASIVIAALAGISRKSDRLTVPMASLFGLLHGFGFANVMERADSTGMAMVTGLLGFNLGVEIGQLIFVAALLPVFWLLARTQRLARVAGPALTTALVVAGGSWLIDRVAAGDWI